MEQQWIDEMQPTLVRLEGNRQHIDTKLKYWVLFVVIPSILIAIFFADILPEPFGVFFAGIGCLAISAAGYAALVSSAKRDYALAYKKCVVGELLERIDAELKYSPFQGIGRETFHGSKLFSTRADRYHTEDLIQGRVGKTDLRFAEVVAEERRRQNKKTVYIKIFRGLLFIADFHKHFHGQTFVYPDTAENLLGSFGRTFQKFAGNRGTQLLQLEDVEFERQFAAYSTDQVEARYILSPAMMSRMVDMQKRLGKDIRIAFKDSCVCIAIPHNGSYLEPRADQAATNVEQIKTIYNEINWLLQIVEELDLNTRIWTKD